MHPEERTEVFAQGLVAGLIGYATVALLLAIDNVLLGRSPFYTAALLGEALFYGLRDTTQVRVMAGPVLAYNGVHLVAFIAMGTVAAWLAWLAERGPHFWYLSMVFFIFIAFHMLGFFLLFTSGLPNRPGPWLSVLASVAAGALMALYLLIARPQLRRDLRISRV